MKLHFKEMAAVVTVVVAAGCASQSGLQGQAKISRADAEKTALMQAPNGTIKEGELEKEGGKLIWSFAISKPDTKDITEVNVNAITGDLVGVENESADKEKHEKD